jgi:hypothetical protein
LFREKSEINKREKMVNKPSSHLLDDIISSIELINKQVESTLEVLRDAKLYSNIEDYVDFIIESVSKVCIVDKKRIISGTDRTDERKIAIALCIYFIKNECNYSYSYMKNIFNKDFSVLSRYKLIVDNMPKNPKSEFDKKLSSHYKKINEIISDRKNKIRNGK